MVKTERNAERPNSAVEALQKKQRLRSMLVSTLFEGDAVWGAGLALIVGGAIFDSLTTIDIGLVGMALGVAMRLGALTEKSKKGNA